MVRNSLQELSTHWTFFILENFSMNFAKMSDRFLTLTLIRTSLLTEAVQVVAAVAAGNLLRKSPRLSHPGSPVFAVGIAKT